VLERGAGCFSVVLEEQNVLEAPVFLEIENAIAEGPENVFDFFSRANEASVALWSGVSMMTSWAPMPFILSNMPSACLFKVPSMPSAGKLVRNDADRPTRSVFLRRIAVGAGTICQDLRWGLAFIAVTDRDRTRP